MRKLLVFFLILLFATNCEQPVKDSELLSAFRASNVENIPAISAHRGGKGLKNFPENCLETMQHLSETIDAIYEIDVSETKDGVLVLMHDRNLDRTTTGSGPLKEKTWLELSQLYLVDDFKQVTTFKIPQFKEVLKWAVANDIVLTVDIKKGVSLKKIVSEIRSFKAEDHCIIITYSLEQALNAYKAAPEMMYSVSARNMKELDQLLASGIPTKNMIAFTGTRLSPTELYERLNELDIVSMLGTLGNLDGRAEARGDHLYVTWKDMGVDILATDRPNAVHTVLKDVN
jgi:glycerophosphoryl diester phosphodiesterase